MTDISTINIPDHEIKSQLGEGGMATVYLAVHQRLQREVALKIMNPDTASNKAFQQSFMTEGRIVAKLEHPNIVTIYDIDEKNGHFYMSMEVLRKGSLKERLANGKLPISNALRVTAQMADALNYAHNKKYIHRDIKPANIMFRQDGSAVLTDFGIAKIQGTTGEMTQMGYISGTPFYMSTEQGTGSHDMDHRADIYSLGIVFYEMLTGDKPYTGTDTVAILYQHVHADIPTLTGENSVFQSILDKALAKKPDDRFNTIREFSEALYEASKTDAETLLMVPALSSEKIIFVKKPIWPWLVAITVIGVSSIAGTYYYSVSTEEQRIAQEQEKLQQQQEQQVIEQTRLEKERETERKLLDAEKRAENYRQEAIRKIMDKDKIKNLLDRAQMLENKRRFFNFSDWSEGCKDYLKSIDGPYDPKKSSESYYKEILDISPDHSKASEALARLTKNKTLSFTGCDDYKSEIEESDAVDKMFD
jgi:type II secretory pathway pseudopilin PulG